MDHDTLEDAWAEEIGQRRCDCRPPRRWPNDTVGGPMNRAQQAHYDRFIATAGIPPWQLTRRS